MKKYHRYYVDFSMKKGCARNATLLQHWKFHWQLVVQGWRISHVLIFHYIFIVNQYSRVTWVSVSTIVVNVQFFVIVSIVTAWSTPSWKPPNFCQKNNSSDVISQSPRQSQESFCAKLEEEGLPFQAQKEVVSLPNSEGTRGAKLRREGSLFRFIVG